MITVEVYAENRMEGLPIATISFTGKGTKCTITSDTEMVEQDLSNFTKTVLFLPKRGRAYPENRQVWMESLPIAHVSVPYWFKIASSTNELQEEEINEDTEDDIEEKDGEEADNSSDDGGDDESDSGDEDESTING